MGGGAYLRVRDRCILESFGKMHIRELGGGTYWSVWERCILKI